MRVVQQSLNVKLIAITLSILVLGMAALLMVQGRLIGDAQLASFEHAAQEKTLLLSEQMKGGVKFRRAESIEGAFARLADPQADSNLANVLVTDMEGGSLVEFTSARYAAFDLGAFNAENAPTLDDTGVLTVRRADHVVTLVRLFDDRNNEVTGFVAMAWSVASAKEQANAIRNTAIALSVVVSLIVIAALAVSLRFLALRPISAIQRVMDDLANGDLNIAIPHLKRSDEIGRMARSLSVFKDNAAERLRLQAEAAETQQAAEEERQRARERTEIERQRMMARLTGAFSDMVQAAARGDFSVRVSADFDDATLNELAESLNAMAMGVEAGLGETRDVLAAVAAYDLSRRVTGAYEGEFATLKNGVNATAENLTTLANSLQSAAGIVTVATGDLVQVSDDLADRTNTQAATIEQTNAAAEQLANTVKDNAERAEQARDNAADANRFAQQGGQVMREATSAIDRVANSSAKISDIIGLIDNVAFQTNLLALNASVEAARAGEAGKGFAVVASEVRRLAQSAGEASGEVKSLIETGAAEVRQGVELVAQAATTLDTIVKMVEQNTSLMGEIADNNQSQTQALSEINTAIRNLSDTTVHNASMAERTNTSLADVSQQVQTIQSLANKFALAPAIAQRHAA